MPLHIDNMVIVAIYMPITVDVVYRDGTRINLLTCTSLPNDISQETTESFPFWTTIPLAGRSGMPARPCFSGAPARCPPWTTDGVVVHLVTDPPPKNKIRMR